MRRFRVSFFLGAVAAVALLVTPAVAQDGVQLTIREAALDDDGSTQVTVAVAGLAPGQVLDGAAFTVSEDGQSVGPVQATRLLELDTGPALAVILALDASGSTAGQAIEDARTAAADFANTLVGQGVRVGLVTFADTAQLSIAPTLNGAQIVGGIESIEAGGSTALYDAVVVASRTLQNFQAQRSIVVFSDGADTSSTADVNGAVSAAQTVSAAVTTVALQTPDLDPDSLQALAEGTGGRVIEVTDSGALSSAFADVAQELTSQYVLTYIGAPVAAPEFDLTVAVSVDGVEASDTTRVTSARGPAAPSTPRSRVLPEDPGILASSVGLYVALGVGFVGLALFLLVLLVPRGDRQVSQTLRRGLRLYDRRGEAAQPTDTTARLASSSFARQAVAMVGRVPKPEGYDERVQLKLDRAMWPMRSTEFTALRVLGAVVGLAAVWGLFANLVLGIIAGVALFFIPVVILDGRVSRRQIRFEEQMPDTLQLMAGALKAGYGVLQAIDTVVKESPEPTATEYSRVLTESRLGLPLEDSLESMADRVGSDDFKWVVVAINIQRRVGGNLAELLDTVADTLRERAMVRRQIKTLSAEGRLSAIILVALPLVIALYLFVVNPAYLGVLFERTIGWIMVGGAVFLMGVGILWMRKLIDIDV